MARPPSEADRDFAKRLQTLGLNLTPERVKTLREVGLLPAPNRRFPGGGGSSGRYPPELVERAREALELADQHHRQLHVAVVTMFVRGRYRVPESKLKRALLRTVNALHRDLLGAAGSPDSLPMDLDEIAISAGVTLAKRIERDPDFSEHRRRIPRSKDRPKRAVLESASTAIVQAHLGGAAPDPEVALEIIRMAGGLQLMGNEAAAEAAALVDPRDLEGFAHADIVAAINQATSEQLDRARDTAVQRIASITSLQASLPTLLELPGPITIGTPATDELTFFMTTVHLVKIINSPDAFETELQDLLTMSERVEAHVALYEFLPLDLRPVARWTNPRPLEELTTSQRADLKQIMEKFVASYPDHARALK